MARFNNILRFIVLHVNFLFATISVAIIAVALYVLFAKWGTLDRGFFLGSGLLLLLLGLISFILSIVGCFGATYQQRKKGYWTGRRIIFVYLIIIFAALAAILYLLCIAVLLVQSLGTISQQLNANSNSGYQPPYLPFENILSSKFNAFFFGAAVSCTDAKFAFFWSWVNAYCDSGINQNNCDKCDDYSITMCNADQNTCAEEGYLSSACPYQSCRAGILKYLLSNTGPFSHFMIAIAVFQFVLVVMNTLMLCYTERDTLERQMYKSGQLGHTHNATKDLEATIESSKLIPLQAQSHTFLQRQNTPELRN